MVPGNKRYAGPQDGYSHKPAARRLLILGLNDDLENAALTGSRDPECFYPFFEGQECLGNTGGAYLALVYPVDDCREAVRAQVRA